MPLSFETVFRAATGNDPYDYQRRLACGDSDGPATIPFLEGRAPSRPHACESRLISIPTGLGKTAAVVLAWLWNRVGNPDEAHRATWPRRLVYCLPMRTLVEQTEGEVRKWIGNLLSKASEVGLSPEALSDLKWLHVHSPVVLMGGEDATDWDVYPEKPAILIGTQDMLLSRALNRGYGMSRARWPMHFGLLNNDCLSVFDEVQLMGSGLPTTAQLEAFRAQIETAATCWTWWMSATSETAWLRTVDYNPALLGSPLELLAEDEASERVDRLLKAHKPVEKAKTLASDTKDLADEIREIADTTNGLTLVVMNTVSRARDIWTELAKPRRGSAPNNPPLLLHSRFRPDDRARILRHVMEAEGKKQIVVSTQVIEAGVDLSATTLVTELAPWSSLVQRFGRCNRRGEYRRDDDGRKARVFWVNKPDDEPHPYTSEQLVAARERIGQLDDDDAAPRNVSSKRIPIPAVDRPPARHVIRHKDFVDLFDTTPDLAGNDIDIDRWVREVDESTVQVFWREWDGDMKGRTPDHRAKPAARAELCPAAIGEFKAFAKRNIGHIWRWDFLDGEWRKVTEAEIFPGQIYRVPAEAGGYTSAGGWDPTSKAPVTPLVRDDLFERTESNATDNTSRTRGLWQSIAKHTDEVCAQLSRIFGDSNTDCPALHLAARWHDLGKAHEQFLAKLKRESRESPEAAPHLPPAKAPDEAWKSNFSRDPDDDPLKRRPHFRHELASALAVLDPRTVLDSTNPVSDELRDLVAYLIAAHHGRVRLSIRSLPREKQPPGDRRFARGVWQGDKLPATPLGADITAPPVTLSLEPMELGMCEEVPFQNLPSWAERMLRLRDTHGPLRLAYWETLLRAADERASALARVPIVEQPPTHELAAEGRALAQTDAGGKTSAAAAGDPGQRGPHDGVRGRAGDSGDDSEDSGPDRTTRYVETTLGFLSYRELAPHLAERVASASLAIEDGAFAIRALDAELILELHQRVCGDLVPEIAGRWRKVDVRVGNLRPAPSHEVAQRMHDYCADLRARWTEASAQVGELTLELLAFAEGRFLTIHPFPDFNGRTIRLFLGELLRRLDLPIVILEAETLAARAAYFAALEAADQNQWRPLMDIWRDRLSHADNPET